MEFICKRFRKNEEKLDKLIEEVYKITQDYNKHKEETNITLNTLSTSLNQVEALSQKIQTTIQSGAGNLDVKFELLESSMTKQFETIDNNLSTKTQQIADLDTKMNIQGDAILVIQKSSTDASVIDEMKSQIESKVSLVAFDKKIDELEREIEVN